MFNSEVLAAVVAGLFSLVGTLLSAMTAVFFFNRLMKKRSNDRQRLAMVREVQFFQAMEKTLMNETGLSQRRLRAKVKNETGLNSTNQFPPSKLERLAQTLEQALDDPNMLE